MNGFASIFMIHVQTIKSILIPNSKRNFMQSKEDLFYLKWWGKKEMGRVITFIVQKLKIGRPNMRSKTELLMLLGKSVVRKKLRRCGNQRIEDDVPFRTVLRDQFMKARGITSLIFNLHSCKRDNFE